MEPSCGEPRTERVPLHLYQEFLIHAAEIEYLKAEIEYLKARDGGGSSKPAKRKRKARKRGK